MPGAPRTPLQEVAAACLALRAVASHRSAALVVGLPGVDPKLEVTIAHRRQVQLEGVQVHRSTSLEQIDLDRCNDIPTTTVTRTVIDLAGVLEGGQLAALTDHVLSRRLVPIGYLRARLDALSTHGRAGVGALRDVLDERQGQHHYADSEPQRRLLALLKGAGLPTPRIEYAIRLPDGSWRFVDAAWVQDRVIVEVDSYTHHSSLSDWSSDHGRNNQLLALGWRVLTISAWQLEHDPQGTLGLIALALQS